MQGDRKSQLQLFLRQLVDFGHQTAGGKADVAHSDVHTLRGGDVLKEAHDLVKIIQRFPDAHEDDVGDALPDVLLGGIDLRADLTGFQVAHPACLGGGAEAAAHPAARL